MKNNKVNIKLSKELLDMLNELKLTSNDTYEDVIFRLIMFHQQELDSIFDYDN